MKTFHSKHVGCYADGANGHKHARAVIADLLTDVGGDSDLFTSLLGPMPDDAWDEDAAIDVLNEHTEPGQSWGFRDGDFGLYQDEED